jgi:rubredoxin
MTYFLKCGHCSFQCEYIDPNDLCGVLPEEAWDELLTCPLCGA